MKLKHTQPSEILLLAYEFNFQDARIQTEACWSQQTSLPKKDFEDHFFSIGWLCRKVYNNFVSLYCIHHYNHVGELVVDLPEVTADVDVSLVHKYINVCLIVS